ncbi:MAG: chemotaxis protein CheD [Candidatus Riflebacteria bacterium]|nr:chemotaxis protein CheD [Candidatus Riflebacteria bacterium]
MTEEVTKRIIHVSIGDLVATRDHVIFQTVLGSCVSACIYDMVHHVAGMNHILLPGEVNYYAYDDSSRFGINAMEKLINELLKIGARRDCLKAKIFGGGHVLPGVPQEKGTGVKNVDFVTKFLSIDRIPLISQSTGGTVTRRILFHTDTFDVFVKRIPTSFAGNVIRDEENFCQQATEQIKKPGEVTLFD